MEGLQSERGRPYKVSRRRWHDERWGGCEGGSHGNPGEGHSRQRQWGIRSSTSVPGVRGATARSPGWLEPWWSRDKAAISLLCLWNSLCEDVGFVLHEVGIFGKLKHSRDMAAGLFLKNKNCSSVFKLWRRGKATGSYGSAGESVAMRPGQLQARWGEAAEFWVCFELELRRFGDKIVQMTLVCNCLDGVTAYWVAKTPEKQAGEESGPRFWKSLR